MIEEVLRQIEHHPNLKSGKNLIVGLSGIEGSGKSTWATALERGLLERGAAVRLIHLDDFLHPKKIRHANPDQVKGYYEDNFDFRSLVRAVLDPVREAISVRSKFPLLELETDQILEQDFVFEGPGVVIVEGVLLFRRELHQKFDVRVWLHISFEDAMERILRRPRDLRYGGVEAIQERYEKRFFPTQRFHLKRDQPVENADVVIDV